MVEVIFKFLIHIILLITALPVGFCLAKLCKEELVPGRKWFIIFLYCLIGILLFCLIFFRKIEILITLIYIMILVLVSLYEGKDERFCFVGKR